MGSPASAHMFRNFSYQKSIDEILAKMTAKIAFLETKIREREARIVEIREAHDITDQDLIKLLTQAANQAVSNARLPMSYNIESTAGETRLIAAGVVQNLVTEQTLIEQEKKSVDQLKMIGRNLKPVTLFGDNGEEYTQGFFSLSFDELDFLGF